MSRKKPLFISLSRRKRRAKTQRIKNLIHLERARCGGVYHDPIDHYEGVSSGIWDWSDIVFLGRDPAVYWNAEIITAEVAFEDLVSEVAFNDVWVKAISDLKKSGDMEALRRMGMNRFVREYPRVDGLNFFDVVNKRKQELKRHSPPPVFCGYRILPGFVPGLGLQMIVESKVLSREVIEEAIADFRARGEKNWLSDVPMVSRPLNGLNPS